MRLTRRRLLESAAVGTAGLAGCQDAGGGGDAPSPTSTPMATDASTADLTPSLSVSDQETDGSTVTIDSAVIDGAGWLVVHPEADDGGPNGGVTLVERQLSSGEYANLELRFDEALESDQTVYAMLHYEDPADGEFTFPDEGDPAVTAGGDPVVTPLDVTVTGGADGGDTTSGGGMATVAMVNTAFDPVRLEIDPGTTVEWVNEDSFGHDVVSTQFNDAAEQWDFETDVGSGQSASYTFESAGVYEYYCSIHGETSMCGAVVVGDASLGGSLPCE